MAISLVEYKWASHKTVCIFEDNTDIQMLLKIFQEARLHQS